MLSFRKIRYFRKFIDDPEKYKELVTFWQEKFIEIFGSKGTPYLTNNYANGEEILDGNPLITSKIDNHRGIRIIQFEEDIEEPLFAAWNSDIQIDGNNFKELVISLQLSQNTLADAFDLIKLFYNNQLSRVILNGINEKYEKRWGLNRLQHVVNASEKFTSNIFASHSVRLNYLKEIDDIYDSMFPTAILKNSLPQNKNVNKFFQNFENLAKVITSNNSIDFGTIHNKKSYINKVTTQHGSISNYFVILVIKSKALSESTEKIKNEFIFDDEIPF